MRHLEASAQPPEAWINAEVRDYGFRELSLVRKTSSLIFPLAPKPNLSS
jgi:hypothetical protein